MADSAVSSLSCRPSTYTILASCAPKIGVSTPIYSGADRHYFGVKNYCSDKMARIVLNMKINKVRSNGIYYTALFNPFKHRVFKNWIRKHNLNEVKVLEPFAGSNSLINMLQSIDCAKSFESFDLYPQAQEVKKRDTLKNYPQGFQLCITNPPWLYKSRAKRLGLKYPNTNYDDLYKYSLKLILGHTDFAGVLLPASFLQSGLFQDRLDKIIFLNKQLFKHTESPVCLALFSKSCTNNFSIYEDNKRIGTYMELKKLLPDKKSTSLSFNQPDGELGLIAIDNNANASIRFCRGKELSGYHIRHSSRSISRITIPGKRINNSFINNLNEYLNNFRINTNDIFLTTFKGLRADGKYRRRLEYRLARNIIGDCI